MGFPKVGLVCDCKSTIFLKFWATTNSVIKTKNLESGLCQNMSKTDSWGANATVHLSNQTFSCGAAASDGMATNLFAYSSRALQTDITNK